MRIFIDCTSTFSTGINTGIERVVRNLAKHAASAGPSLGLQCQAVVLAGNHYVPVAAIEHASEKQHGFALRSAANKVYLLFVRKLARRLPRAWQPFLTGSKHEPSLARLVVSVLRPLQQASRLVRAANHRLSHTQPTVQFRQGDVLLLADSVWNYAPWAAVQAAKSAGAHIAAIVYDIIPVTHPQFFALSSREKFASALPLLLRNAGTFLCISAYTQAQLRAYLAAQADAATLGPKRFCNFTLGVELDSLATERQVRTKLSSVFSPARPVYLVVGTLEPRKNHAYLLQVFQELWDTGNNSALLIVGRVGWMCEELLETIQRHPRLGQQLFFMDDVGDAELDYCYAHARALLFSSVVEGFGLPIIEALHRGLAVFASDIPVFREVGGEYLVYFDLAAPASLAGLLQEYEATGVYPARPPVDFSWPDWSQSTKGLLSQLAAMYSSKVMP